ncbi:Uncharacterized protein Fot_39648 [Forsythia ovata]|uniref:Uncharacterized protein n=1 Tax=Forsythia ovata TaxID=205694 RepID=A0ABD1S564_9LAMI
MASLFGGLVAAESGRYLMLGWGVFWGIPKYCHPFNHGVLLEHEVSRRQLDSNILYSVEPVKDLGGRVMGPSRVKQGRNTNLNNDLKIVKTNETPFVGWRASDLTTSIDLSVLQERLTNMINLG